MSGVGSIGSGSSTSALAQFQEELLLEEQQELEAQLAAAQQQQVTNPSGISDQSLGSGSFSSSTTT